MGFAHAFLLLAGMGLLIAAALHDAAFRTVPNQCAAILALCGLALRMVAGNLPGAMLAAVLVLLVTMFFWRRGWMGGGDVKLLCAVTLLIPPIQVPAMLCFVALAGGVLALPYAILRKRLPAPSGARPTVLWARVFRAERHRLRRGGPLPYAVAIAAGAGIAIVRGAAL